MLTLLSLLATALWIAKSAAHKFTLAVPVMAPIRRPDRFSRGKRFAS